MRTPRQPGSTFPHLLLRRLAAGPHPQALRVCLHPEAQKPQAAQRNQTHAAQQHRHRATAAQQALGARAVEREGDRVASEGLYSGKQARAKFVGT